MTKESKKYRIYDKTTKQWYEIPEDQYRDYDRWCTALRKRMQYRDECFCPRSKWWLCDGNCLDCEFYISPTESLDAPILSDDGATNATLMDFVSDPRALPENHLMLPNNMERIYDDELFRTAKGRLKNPRYLSFS